MQKLLIANRGEIACQIVCSARQLDIAAVAFHSEADSGALHVGAADEAVPVRPSPAAQSYLNVDRLRNAAHASRADAVYPASRQRL